MEAVYESERKSHRHNRYEKNSFQGLLANEASLQSDELRV